MQFHLRPHESIVEREKKKLILIWKMKNGREHEERKTDFPS